ncbi:MAG: HEPN domain-containing protein [Albidovulum sp.]|nr:HEPN domain-containing protein [Albidovulum sp.]
MSRFKSDDSEDFEMAINRLSSSIHRNRGWFWLRDRILDAAVCLELMYQLKPPELINKLASRAAHLLATGTGKLIEIHDQVHVFYKARSNIAHGG